MDSILGFPGDDEADYRATLEFVQGIGRLYARDVAHAGLETGFVPFAFYTRIYAGSPLAGSMEAFLAEHPERTDGQGVTVLGDSLRRFPQSFSVAATLMRYDKAKD